MSQNIYSIKLTPSGGHYCVAYPAQGDKPLAVSKQVYDNAEDAMIDVMRQLGVLPAEEHKPNFIERILSAAAGGVR